MAEKRIKIAVSGIPRGYHFPQEDGNWLTDHHRMMITSVSPLVDLIEVPASEVQKTDLNGIEIVLAEGGNRTHYPGELDWEDYLHFSNPALKWIQLCSTGFSDNITPEILSGKVFLTNAPGLHTIPIAESVMAAMLQYAKQLQMRKEDQANRRWIQRKNRELNGSVVLIVGLGKIGQEVARLCKSFGMRVIGTRLHAQETPFVDEVFTAQEINSRLPQADYVVMAVPLTGATKNMLNKEGFAAMKATSFLINIGRGQTVCEHALVDALIKKKIGGAYLDAFVEEPLPQGHVLWNLEGCVIVPHDSHSSPHIGDRMVEIFCENLQLYVSGQPLNHVCDPKRGY
jgi:phosphoglycerate dehydrogenase-like enzyme